MTHNNLPHTPGAPNGRPRVSNRRQFLKQGVATLAGIPIASRFAYAANSAPKKMRIGIVGGGFGSSYFFHQHPDCIVEAVSDLRPERRDHLMRIYRCQKAYDSLEELVRDPKIDAVGVFTDATLHVEHTVKAMKHGKHVLSAVPAAWASLDQCYRLKETVEKAGLIYMMAETSYYQQETISARKFYQEGKFGKVIYCESEYQHPGLESLFWQDGRPTWRHGMAPIHYPTHCTAHLVGVTGDRLTEVVCQGWGNQSPVLKDNAYNNPFYNETATFKTRNGISFRVKVWWEGAVRGIERAEWIGTTMSFYGPTANGMGPVIVRAASDKEKDDAGFQRARTEFQPYETPKWWQTAMLPEPLRHDSGHQGSHTFLTHEFVDSVVHARRPAVDIYTALACTAPGIVAHQSALQQGELLKIPSFDPA